MTRVAAHSARPREGGDQGPGATSSPRSRLVGAEAFFVYILASDRNGTLYVGMTDNLVRRVWEHRTGAVAGFTRQYGVKTLVWFECHGSRHSAFLRERQLKK
ncbi:GIY-YIG nuclease family protein [Rhodoplanes elegans]|uniref:GIY-YIG nuclease family protein n=1 Tax=Rhodoplanes elegans TaxID=29408 RepID=UPI003B8306F5